MAQRWIDRRLAWCYSFNHGRPFAAFKIRLLKTLAVPWGIAYANGPFYNKPWGYYGKLERGPTIQPKIYSRLHSQ